MTSLRLSTLALFGALCASHEVRAQGGGAPRAHTATSSVSILADKFPMPDLLRDRRVWIYLPPDYKTSTKRYPVIYMHDGQNVFDAATSFVGEWGVDETLDSLQQAGDWGAIVVAIDNDGKHRLDEYNPWKHTDPKYGGGEGDLYLDFITYRLKPYIDRTYRTRPDRMNTAIVGSSLGGLISLYAVLRYPAVYGKAGVLSGALWIADPMIYAMAQNARPLFPKPSIYFVAGDSETADGSQVRDQTRMLGALVRAGFPLDTSVKAVASKDGKHSEWFWRREFPAAYQWLFPATGVDSTMLRARAKSP